MDKITIELPVQAWNVVLQALIQRPYSEVFEVVAEIKRQGDAAVRVSPADEDNA
jgi:hypothetical protein